MRTLNSKNKTKRGGLGVKSVFGHSGDVIADGSLESLIGDSRLGLERQVAGRFLVEAEEFFEGLYGLACGLVNFGVVVEVFEEVVFELLFGGLELRGIVGEGLGMKADVIGGLGLGLSELGLGCGDDIFGLAVDNGADDEVAAIFGLGFGKGVANLVVGLCPYFQVLGELDFGEETRLNAVIKVMAVIGDFIGEVGDLSLKAGIGKVELAVGRRRVAGGVMFGEAFADFPSKIEAGEVRVFVFEELDDAEALTVVFEAAGLGHELVEGLLAFVAEGGVAEVVGKGDGFGKVFVEVEGLGEVSGNGGDFDGMGKACAKEAAGAVKEDLGFVAELAKRARVDDSVAVSLIAGSPVFFGLRVASASGSLAFLSEGSEESGFSGFAWVAGGHRELELRIGEVVGDGESFEAEETLDGFFDEVVGTAGAGGDADGAVGGREPVLGFHFAVFAPVIVEDFLGGDHFGGVFDEVGGEFGFAHFGEMGSVGGVVSAHDKEKVHRLLKECLKGGLAFLGGAADGVEKSEVLADVFGAVFDFKGVFEAALDFFGFAAEHGGLVGDADGGKMEVGIKAFGVSALEAVEKFVSVAAVEDVVANVINFFECEDDKVVAVGGGGLGAGGHGFFMPGFSVNNAGDAVAGVLADSLPNAHHIAAGSVDNGASNGRDSLSGGNFGSKSRDDDDILGAKLGKFVRLGAAGKGADAHVF